MNTRTIIILLILSPFIWTMQSCKVQEELTEEQKIRLRLQTEREIAAKEAKKLQKEREKYYWSLQTPAVAKSLKKNAKKQRKRARKLKRNRLYNNN